MFSLRSLTSMFVSCTARLMAAAALLASLALAESAQAAIFPNDGTNQLVNVIRRYDNGLPLYSIVQSAQTGSVSGGSPAAMVDGGHTTSQWNGVNDAGDSATIQLTLDQPYDIRTFRHVYESGGNYLPANYDISVSNIGFGSLTSVASGGVPSVTQTNTLGSPVTAQYVQFQWSGQGGPQPFVLMREFQIFADASSGLQSNGGWNASRTPATVSTAFGSWADAVGNIVDGNVQDASYLRGTPGSDDAVLINLGSMHMIESIGLGFYSGQAWGNGMTIELSPDNVTFTQVYDTNASVTQSHVNVADMAARYIRVTNKNGSNGALSEFEVFADALPVLTSTPAVGSTIDLSGTETLTTTFANAITLQNTGELTSELQITGFTLTGPDAALFDVPDFLATLLTAGGSDTVQFDLDFLAPGASDTLYQAVLTFQTNLGDFAFNLEALSQPVPEPSSLGLALLGALGMLGSRRSRRMKSKG